jgi:tRNA pseudouridine55 synthase
MHGYIVVDKPAGMTSHDVVARVRRILKMKKVGHTGTLDPFATGVLPVALGEGTKAIPFLDEGVKEYRAVMKLGVVTDTDDVDGTVIAEHPLNGINETMIRETAAAFTGTINQIPPMFSALKRNGVPLYKLARKGEEVEREPRQVTLSSLFIDRIELPVVAFTVRCSRGTYVRAVARDMGERLGCGAHLTELRRTASGPFTLGQALTLEQLAAEAASEDEIAGFIPLAAALSHLVSVPLTAEGTHGVRCGKVPVIGYYENPLPPLGSGERLLLTRDGKVVAVAEAVQEGGDEKLRLLRGFN